MNRLNYATLEQVGYKGYILRDAPVRALQFGEGNFLRAFTDYFFDAANEKADWNGKIAVLQPNGRDKDKIFNEQDGLYTVYLRGKTRGQIVSEKRVISVISRAYNTFDHWEELAKLMESDDLEYIISNTTEAGIAYDGSVQYDDTPPKTFPAKLAKLLYVRFKAKKPGLIVLSCELIDNNGKELQKLVLQHGSDWKLGEDFLEWVREKNEFCSTLVDRIVPGQPKDEEERVALAKENGYEDALLDVGEIYGVWYIEGDINLENKLPFKKAKQNVHVVPSIIPYKKRKVRILNGAHTGFSLGAFLAGKNTVRECMEEGAIKRFMNQMIYQEIIPILPLDKRECEQFAASVEDRFNNPFMEHQLISIALNSTAKWKARDLPSLLEYRNKFSIIPTCLAMSLSFYIAFCSSGILERRERTLLCRRMRGDLYEVTDEDYVLDFFYERKDNDVWTITKDVLTNEKMWDMNLTAIPGLETMVAENLNLIRTKGVLAAFDSCSDML